MSSNRSSGSYVLTRISHYGYGRFEALLASIAAGIPPREVQPHELWTVAARGGTTQAANPELATLTFKRGMCRAMDLDGWKNNARDVTLLALDSAGREVARYTLFEAWPPQWIRGTAKVDGFAIKQKVLPARGSGVNQLVMEDTAGAEKTVIEEMSLNYGAMRRF